MTGRGSIEASVGGDLVTPTKEVTTTGEPQWLVVTEEAKGHFGGIAMETGDNGGGGRVGKYLQK